MNFAITVEGPDELFAAVHAKLVLTRIRSSDNGYDLIVRKDQRDARSPRIGAILVPDVERDERRRGALGPFAFKIGARFRRRKDFARLPFVRNGNTRRKVAQMNRPGLIQVRKKRLFKEFLAGGRGRENLRRRKEQDNALPLRRPCDVAREPFGSLLIRKSLFNFADFVALVTLGVLKRLRRLTPLVAPVVRDGRAG